MAGRALEQCHAGWAFAGGGLRRWGIPADGLLFGPAAGAGVPQKRCGLSGGPGASGQVSGGKFAAGMPPGSGRGGDFDAGFRAGRTAGLLRRGRCAAGLVTDVCRPALQYGADPVGACMRIGPGTALSEDRVRLLLHSGPRRV